MSDTPRTDAAKLKFGIDQDGNLHTYSCPNHTYFGDVCRADEMEKLERDNAELNTRLEERTQDHIKASARDVAEIQRLRVELDTLKRRTVKPLVWFHNADDVADANISRADGINCEYVVVHRIAGGYDVAVWINSSIAKKVDGASMQACRDIAEDLHREAVLALLETEA